MTPDIASAADRALRGNADRDQRTGQADPGQQAVRPGPAGAADRPGDVGGRRAAGQRAGPGRRPPGRRGDHRAGPGRRPPGVRDGQRPDGQSWFVGRPDGGEDRPADRVRTGARAAGGVAGRLGRGTDHRSDPAVPGPAGCRADLLQPGPAVGPSAPGVLPVRAVGGGRGLHPELLRCGVHGRGQRLDVPGLAPHGGDGDRRARHLGGDGWGPDACDGVGMRRQPGGRRRRCHRHGPQLAVVHADVVAGGAAGGRGGQAGHHVDGVDDPAGADRGLRHSRRDLRPGRRRQSCSK